MNEGTVKLIHTINDGDVILKDGLLCRDGGLETMVYLSLFGGNESGDQWWGNRIEDVPERKYFSETQKLLASLPLTVNNLSRINNAVKKDLEAVDAVKEIETSIIDIKTVKIKILLIGDQSVEFAVNWTGHDTCLEEDAEVITFPKNEGGESDLEEQTVNISSDTSCGNNPVAITFTEQGEILTEYQEDAGMGCFPQINVPSGSWLSTGDATGGGYEMRLTTVSGDPPTPDDDPVNTWVEIGNGNPTIVWKERNLSGEFVDSVWNVEIRETSNPSNTVTITVNISYYNSQV